MNQTEQKKVFIDHSVFLAEPEAYEKYKLVRVIEQHKDLYKVMLDQEQVMSARVSGRIMFQYTKITDYPAVGDWVLIEDNLEYGIIHHIMNRKSILERKSAGKTSDVQILATNIDIIFICMSANENFNLRRLERYLSVSWSSGATLVIILTKIDLTTNLKQMLFDIYQIAFGVDVLISSEFVEPYYKQIENYLKSGMSYAFIGSSGVGKSTIINKFLMTNKQKTIEIGSHDKGRHSTTSRELFFTQNQAIIIDTPGMRELQLDEADIETTFQDIEQLSKKCKFTDCTHKKEPGCAVKDAIMSGDISRERLSNYHKLLKELKYQKLKAKRLELKYKKR